MARPTPQIPRGSILPLKMMPLVCGRASISEGIDMSEGKYIEEVHRRLCEVPEDADALAALLGIANEVATAHPVWYERFRIRSKITRAWRWLMK